MGEGDRKGMQCHAADRRGSERRAVWQPVERIRDDRAAQCAQVGADLMRIACVRLRGDQGCLREAFQHLEIRFSGFAELRVDHRSVLAVAVLAQRELGADLFPGRYGAIRAR